MCRCERFDEQWWPLVSTSRCALIVRFRCSSCYDDRSQILVSCVLSGVRSDSAIGPVLIQIQYFTPIRGVSWWCGIPSRTSMKQHLILRAVSHKSTCGPWHEWWENCICRNVFGGEDTLRVIDAAALNPQCFTSQYHLQQLENRTSPPLTLGESNVVHPMQADRQAPTWLCPWTATTEKVLIAKFDV